MAMESLLAVSLLRAGAPPAALAAAWGPAGLQHEAQEALVRLLRSCPRAPDAAFLRRFVDAVAAVGGAGGDEWALHDGLYELAAAQPTATAPTADAGPPAEQTVARGAYLSFYLHPALLDGCDAGAAPRTTTLARPLASVFRSTTFSDVSTTTWPAALALVDAVGLAAWATAGAADARLLARWRRLWSGVRVVELGAGTGLAGLCIASLSERTRAWREQPGDSAAGLRVAALTLTDGDPRSVALMRANADANGLPTVRCLELNWGDAAPPSELLEEPEGQQPYAVIGSDVVYDPRAVQPLVSTLCALLLRDRRGTAAAPVGAAAAPVSATPARDLTAALDAVLGAGCEAGHRRPFGLLANARRNAATYEALEAALDASELSWLDVTAELARLAAARPVLDLRLPPSLGEPGPSSSGTQSSDIRTVLVW